MIVISPAELRNNMKKYLDMSMTEKIVIQRGKTDTFILSGEKHLSSEENLARAITGEELLKKVIPRIEKLFDK